MRDELLALLEEKPYRIAELTALLGRSRTGVYDVLCGLRADGLVRVDHDRWRLTESTPAAHAVDSPRPGGRRPPPGTAKQSDRVLAALIEGPLSSADVARRIGLPLKTCSAWLSQLTYRGAVVQCGFQENGGRGGRPLIVYKRSPAVPAADAAWAEQPCEGCGKPVKWHGRKHPRCPDCQLEAGRVRFTERLAQRRDHHADEVDRLAQIEEPPPTGDTICEADGCGRRFPRHTGIAGRFCSLTCYQRPAAPATRTIVSEGQEFEATSIGASSLTEWPDGVGGGSSLSGLEYGSSFKR